MVLIVACVGWGRGDYLTDAEYVCGLSEGGPEIFIDMLDGVNAETVN